LLAGVVVRVSSYAEEQEEVAQAKLELMPMVQEEEEAAKHQEALVILLMATRARLAH